MHSSRRPERSVARLRFPLLSLTSNRSPPRENNPSATSRRHRPDFAFHQLPTSNFVRVTVPPEDPAENSCDRVAICARWYEVNQRAGMLPKWWGSATAAARNHQRRCSAPARMAHFFLLKNTTSSLQLVLISRLIQNGFDLQTPAGVLYLVIARASAGIGIDPSRVTLTFCPNEVSVPSMIISRK